MQKPDKTERPSVADLEAILEAGQGETIEIMPDGSIRQTGIVPTPKPLTARKDLGDNY